MVRTTTLAAIKAHKPCSEGWCKLLKYLGKTQMDNEALDFETILESNGLEDALWALCVLPDSDKNKVRLLACDFVESILHHIPEGEARPAKAIQVARMYAKDKATLTELMIAKNDVYALVARPPDIVTYHVCSAVTWAIYGAIWDTYEAIDILVGTTNHLESIFKNWLQKMSGERKY